MNCYEAALELILKSRETLGKFVGNYGNLEIVCRQVGEVAKDCDAEFVDVEVNMDRRSLDFFFGCPEIVVQDKGHVIFDLANRVSTVQFYKAGEDVLGVCFSIVGLWEGKDER